ncbi:MAG: alpha/beta fold hydrolase [Candidatus Rokubacteria bacterium]|nr:alpha/beta fold hydrolase [Candidatus Rokubacteria bacterium]
MRGFLHRAVRAEADAGVRHQPLWGDGLVLAHGAGSSAESPLLVSLASAFARNGACVLRCDLPFRQARRRGPPSRGDAARDREGLARAVAAMRSIVRGRVFLGGHSYGGRQASMVAAERPGLADALLLLSYPLHPPGRAAEQRTSHFPALATPALFVHGTRDPFGSLEAVTTATQRIPARVDVLAAGGAGHDLARGRALTALATRVVEQFNAFVSRHEAGPSQKR